jgi:uncharacterized membrane protein YqjE
MTADSRQTGRPDRTGLIAGLIGMARDVGGLLCTRLELAALEVAELRANLLRLAIVLAAAFLMLSLAVTYWSVLVVYLAWDALGWKILPLVAAVLTLLGIALLRHARRMIEQGKLSLPATMAELRNDRDTLL